MNRMVKFIFLTRLKVLLFLYFGIEVKLTQKYRYYGLQPGVTVLFATKKKKIILGLRGNNLNFSLPDFLLRRFTLEMGDLSN